MLLVVALHAAGGLALTYLGTRTATPPEIRPIEVSFIPLAAPPQPEIQPPAPPKPVPVQKPAPPVPVPVQKPAPPKPKPVKRPPPPKAAPPKPAEPVVTQSATALSSAEPEPVAAPAPIPPAMPAPADPAPAAPAPISAARFDADYLNNPAPAYPPLSRRMREEGKVMLRVVVKPDGLPGRIETARSSGSERLDAAARNAVSRWRFVPARQGEHAIESSVLVPIIFKLEGN